MINFRKMSFLLTITIVMLMLSLPAFAGNTAKAKAKASSVGVGSQQQGIGIEDSFNSPGKRAYGVPGGLILPGFPTNVDTNGGTGAMYLDTRTQLRFKNTWTAEELKAGNSKWCGNEIHTSMYVSKTSERSPVIQLDYIRKVQQGENVVDVLPIDTKKYEYKFVGYAFARAKSAKLMAPENTIDAAREMRKYGANFGVVLNDGVEKTMVASSFGISLGYTRFDINGDGEGSAGTAVAGIGVAKGKAGMRGFPWVQFACFKRTLKADKAAKIAPIKTNTKAAEKTIIPVKDTPKKEMAKPAETKKPVKFKTNIKGYVPNLATD